MKEQVSWNLYDLVDEATPGVMEVSLKDIEQADDLDRSLYTRTLRTGNKRFVARVYGEGVFERSQPHSLANALLLAHFWNHFIAAVDGVETALRADICPYCGRDNRGDGNGCTSDDCSGVALLKQLTEVERSDISTFNY